MSRNGTEWSADDLFSGHGGQKGFQIRFQNAQIGLLPLIKIPNP